MMDNRKSRPRCYQHPERQAVKAIEQRRITASIVPKMEEKSK